MLLQQSPFRGEDEDEIYDAILADEPLYPIHMPRDSVSILQKLLTREPELRLGSGPTDAQEIMSHAFFRNINWDDVYHKRIRPPFVPQITSATDTSNFDTEFTSVTPVLTPVQSGKSSSRRQTLKRSLTIFPQFFPKPCKKSSEASPTLRISTDLARYSVPGVHHLLRSENAGTFLHSVGGLRKDFCLVRNYVSIGRTTTNDCIG